MSDQIGPAYEPFIEAPPPWDIYPSSNVSNITTRDNIWMQDTGSLTTYQVVNDSSRYVRHDAVPTPDVPLNLPWWPLALTLLVSWLFMRMRAEGKP